MGDVLTTHQVADICNVHRATVVRWIKDGVLPAQQTLGGRYRVHRVELERLATERDLCLSDVPPTGSATPVLETANPLASATILVVDDDATMRSLATAAFAASGMDSASVDTGYAALDAVLKNRSIRIVVLDLHLPGLNGLDTLVEMRRIRSDLKVVVASGAMPYFDFERIRALSDAQLEKPFSLESLVTLCRSFGCQDSKHLRALAASG